MKARKIRMMSQVANLLQYYQKWVSEEKKFPEYFNKNQLIYQF